MYFYVNSLITLGLSDFAFTNGETLWWSTGFKHIEVSKNIAISLLEW